MVILITYSFVKAYEVSMVKKYWIFYLRRSAAMVLSEHLPRPGIRTPDLSALSPKVLSIGLPRWCCIRDGTTHTHLHTHLNMLLFWLRNLLA